MRPAGGSAGADGEEGRTWLLRSRPEIDLDELAARAAEFETRRPARSSPGRCRALRQFAVTLACSFQDCVIIDLAVAVDPRIEVLFLDTGFHFPETLAYVEEVRARYDLNLRVITPGPEADAWPCGSERCCELRKVEPLDRALAGPRGVDDRPEACRRPHPGGCPHRVVGRRRASLVKINPVATWTDDDIANYETDHGLPMHPLMSQGYLSIGCAPTTRPVAPGEDPRAGRWAGMRQDRVRPARLNGP